MLQYAEKPTIKNISPYLKDISPPVFVLCNINLETNALKKRKRFNLNKSIY
jgi:hypothetical protein